MSHAVKKLEEGLGVSLVARSGRTFRFTEEGEILFRSARRAFNALDEATESIAHTLGAPLGKVRLGATVEFGCSILVKHLEEFVTSQSGVHVDLTFSNDLLTPLIKDELDVIIDCVDHQVEGVERIPLFRELYAVVCSPRYKASHHIEHPDLDHCTVISLDEDGSWWHHFLYSIPGVERPSLKKHHFMTINLIRAMIIAAKHHMGVALVPLYSVTTELSQGHLVQLFPQIHLLEDQFSLYQKEDRRKLLRHTQLVDYLLRVRPNELPQVTTSSRP